MKRNAIGLRAIACGLLSGAAPALHADQPTQTQPARVFDAAPWRSDAQRIIDAARSSPHAYARLTELCDDIGPRLSGSVGMERAVRWAVEVFQADGHERVRAEPVQAPKWVRGSESLEMLEPHAMPLPMLGLGGSSATPPEGITAEVVSVASLEELSELGERVRGKIVLFDAAMSPENAESGAGYGTAVQYRVAGARWAIQHGAVAALVRSVTTRSLQTPHTGALNYLDARQTIPAAAVTTEHAALITRLQQRGKSVRVRLKMEARMEGMAPTANVVAELRGREAPDEIVVIAAHLDSWDVGQGAQDDGGGCATVIEALRLLRTLSLTPRRTIRAVLYANEENGLRGARQYVIDHADELSRHVAAIESDGGTYALRGFSVESSDKEREARAAQDLAGLLRLVEPLGGTQVRRGYSGADIGPMKPAGVALLGLNVDMTHYFDVHHTHADTLDKVDPRHLQECSAAMAIVAYVLADMPGRLGE